MQYLIFTYMCSTDLLLSASKVSLCLILSTRQRRQRALRQQRKLQQYSLRGRDADWLGTRALAPALESQLPFLSPQHPFDPLYDIYTSASCSPLLYSFVPFCPNCHTSLILPRITSLKLPLPQFRHQKASHIFK